MKSRVSALAVLALAASSRAASASPNESLIHELNSAGSQVERLSLFKQDSDFVFDFLAGNGAATSPQGSVVAASVNNFPALLGQGIAMSAYHHHHHS